MLRETEVVVGRQIEFGGDGIRINCIQPSVLVNTEITGDNTAFLDANVALTPLGRGATSADVVDVVLFLAGDESAFVTGADVPVDGGLTSGGLFTEIHRRMTAAPALRS